MDIQSFLPPLRTLMGPGPSDVHPRVLQAMSRQTIGHLDPAFVAMMDEVKSMLKSAFIGVINATNDPVMRRFIVGGFRKRGNCHTK